MQFVTWDGPSGAVLTPELVHPTICSIEHRRPALKLLRTVVRRPPNGSVSGATTIPQDKGHRFARVHWDQPADSRALIIIPNFVA
ncbi:uncharacterized protein PGTG_18558, partial [Puccinia graminis f. sp. tritici CRL 75-36-700-3]